MRTFKGRVIAGGKWEGEAVVSHAGVNTLATFQKSAMANKSQVIVSDQNNPDIYGRNITGKALCLPVTIGSTTGGLVIQTVCAMNINPACFLFSKHIDSLAASGIVLAKVWEGSNVIAIDRFNGCAQLLCQMKVCLKTLFVGRGHPLKFFRFNKQGSESAAESTGHPRGCPYDLLVRRSRRKTYQNMLAGTVLRPVLGI